MTVEHSSKLLKDIHKKAAAAPTATAQIKHRETNNLIQ